MLKKIVVKIERIKYHFYGSSWALFVWGLEVIPDLAKAVAICNAGIYPRFKRWTFVKSNIEQLQPLFETKANGIWEMRPDEYEATTHYWLLVAGVNDDLGVQFAGPGVFGHRQARARYSGGDHNEPSIEHVEWRRSSRQDHGKRPRGQVVDTSSSSSHHDQSGGDHPVDSGRRSHSHRAPRPRYGDESSAPAPSQWSEQDWQRMQHMMRESEGRIARNVEESLFTRIKNWFEEKLDVMRCRCSHSTDVHVPRPAPRSHSERRREPEPESEPAQCVSSEAPSHHGSPTHGSPAHESPAREVGHPTGDGMHTPQWQHDPFGSPTTFGDVQTPHMGV
ncbi:uncharacterized protein LOC131005069 [Salvia miltiorrhiza]|uniref:uncharacterized protein LOC131005069 n=1 Tax=Salvia miltiorrhiza TaxID=226208 RepID=UPI0025AC9244|nr:uncharacterized protein LOC131005069 [Salvia miltiorrhiza]